MYVKLFAKILDSSIWEQSPDIRIVWITMLASMDADGFCQFATPEALARRSRVKLYRVRQAIAVLESPDSQSSTPDDDGRRISRVAGGWVVLNAKKYRDISRAGELRRSRLNLPEVASTCPNLPHLASTTDLTTNGINKSLPEVEVEVDIKNKSKVADAPIFVLPVWIDSEVWRDFEEMRTKIRKKLTDGARRRIVAKLEAYRTASFDPNSILGTSIENGWAGVFEPKSFYGREAKPAQVVTMKNPADEMRRQLEAD